MHKHPKFQIQCRTGYKKQIPSGFGLLFAFIPFFQYRARAQDGEKLSTQAVHKQSQVRQSNQLLLIFPPFPVRHPALGHGTYISVHVDLFLEQVN